MKKHLYKRIGLFILPVMLLHGIISFAQTDFRGAVYNTDGKPLHYASVYLVGSDLNVQTDSSGIFRLAVNPGDKIEVRQPGYLSKTISLKGKNPKIVLVKDPGLQKENVAYGQFLPRELTYSVSTVHAKDIDNNTVYSSANALYGKIPGLFVLQEAGEPGIDLPQLFVRMKSTTAGNVPLILVDGVERDINEVILEDIESISVLKDAASTVMFGVRAANGVIVVTTKRGNTGKVAIHATVEQNLIMPTRTPKFRNSADYLTLYNQALTNDGLLPQFSEEVISNYRNGNSTFYPDVNWVDEVMKKSTTATRANINAKGGDERTRYYVSAGYIQAKGLFKNTESNDGYSTNSNLNRFNFRSNLDVDLTKNWFVGVDLSGRLDKRNAPYIGSGGIIDLLHKYPSHLFPVYVQDKMYGGTTIYPNNPVGYLNSRGYREINERMIRTSIYTKYSLNNFVKGLSAGARYSRDSRYQNQQGYTRTFSVRELLGQNPDSGNPILSDQIGQNTNLVPFGPEGDFQLDRTLFEADASYSRTFGDKHDVFGQVVYHQDNLREGSASPMAFQFISSRFHYGFKKKYFAELGMSYSGTEAFPPDNRYGFFPALSAGWILSEENFLKNNKVVDYLKFRVSSGKVGNSSVLQRFAYISQYQSGAGYVFGNNNTGQSGLQEGVVPNRNFKWEDSYKTDIGIEARLWSALDLSFTYFYQKRSDILTTQANILPALYGGSLPNVNAGVVRNQGIELSLQYANEKNDLAYNAGINVSYVNDRITSFPEAPQPYDYLYSVGQQLSKPLILEAIGFFRSDEDIQNSPTQNFGPVKPGDIKYKDQNNDGVIDNLDRKYSQKPDWPNWDLSLNLGLKYKGFDVSTILQGQLGRSIYLGNTPYLFWPFANDGARISTYAKQFWTPENMETADYPRLSTAGNANNYRASSFWYVNGDFLKMRVLDLGYTLPARLISNTRIGKLRIYLRGTNLFSLDHLKYTDPESQNNYPITKSYNVGLSVQL